MNSWIPITTAKQHIGCLSVVIGIQEFYIFTFVLQNKCEDVNTCTFIFKSYVSKVTPFPTRARGLSDCLPLYSISKNTGGSTDPLATDKNDPIFIDSAQSLSLQHWRKNN